MIAISEPVNSSVGILEEGFLLGFKGLSTQSKNSVRDSEERQPLDSRLRGPLLSKDHLDLTRR